MKCLVLGAGAQGAAAASILARARDVESFVLADYDAARLEAVKARLALDGKADAGKVTTAPVDAGDVDAVARLAAGVDVILNFVDMDFSAGVRRRPCRPAPTTSTPPPTSPGSTTSPSRDAPTTTRPSRRPV